MEERGSSPPLPPDPPPSTYPGEDVRPTSRKELAGWYLYGFAAEVFVVCGMGSFVPITLEQLARENGVLLSDRKTSCKAGLDVGLPPSARSLSASFKKPGHKVTGQCIVTILGIELNTASFAMYTFSLSVLIQALLLISMSTFADHGRYRKTLLLIFAFTGAVATLLFLPMVSGLYLMAAFLAIIANTCIGSSFVLLNSFLPLLVRHHPSIHTPIALPDHVVRTSIDQLPRPEAFTDDDDEDADNDITLVNSTSALLSADVPDRTKPFPKSPAAASPELQLSTKISSNGIGIGYLAAVIVQILSVFIVSATGSTTFSLRLVLFFIGAWWLVFTIPAALWLRPRPGPPLQMNQGATTLAYMAYAWRSLGRTAMRARRLKDVLLFLAAWFLLSDGIATVSGTAVLFAKTTLGMKPAALAMINVVVMISGVTGAFTWSRASRALGLKPSQTILACICVFEIIPLYALIGYIPGVQRLGVFGLQQPWEMYPLGAVYGLVLGGLSSYCRALFGELVPPGFEAAFFALYAITDKGSSIFGPAIVGAITDATGDIRPAFWFLAVLIGLPIPLMYFVNVERGKIEGAVMAKELEGQAEHHHPRNPIALET